MGKFIFKADMDQIYYRNFIYISNIIFKNFYLKIYYGVRDINKIYF